MNERKVLLPGTGTAVQVYTDTALLSRGAANAFVEFGRASILQRGQYNVALAGGSTPRSVYQLLASEYAEALSWERVHLFFGDERHVPPDDAQSNYRMVRETLLSNAAVRAITHRIESELPAKDAADRYQEELRKHFQLSQGSQPRFDLVLLGLGTDGHTASLFPNTAALDETSRIVAANVVPQLRTERITLTFPALNHARQLLFLAAGSDKSGILAKVLRGNAGAESYPAQRVKPIDGKLLWMVDAAAGGELSG